MKFTRKNMLRNCKKASALCKGLIFGTIVTFVLCLAMVDLLRVKITQASVLELPEPTQLLDVSQVYSLPILKGIKLNEQDPLQISFIVDSADKGSIDNDQAQKLINYFMAALTVPAEQLWVNLSPYENDRIMDDKLAITDLGKEFLSQDYVLKQFSSSITYPKSAVGQKFWTQAQKKIAELDPGAINDINTFNKIWIVPGQVKVLENGYTAVISEAKLQTMMEQDYLARDINKQADGELSDVSTELMREFLLPEINKEVNEGKHFAKLRQVYGSIILAMWFKNKFKESFYKHYFDKAKLEGIDINDKDVKDKIYNLYTEAFKKGVYDYIGKSYNPVTKTKEKRRYFSGGVDATSASALVRDNITKVTVGDLVRYLGSEIKNQYLIVKAKVESATEDYSLEELRNKQKVVTAKIDERKKISEQLKQSYQRGNGFQIGKETYVFVGGLSGGHVYRWDGSNLDRAVINYMSFMQNLKLARSGLLNGVHLAMDSKFENSEKIVSTHELTTELNYYKEYETYLLFKSDELQINKLELLKARQEFWGAVNKDLTAINAVGKKAVWSGKSKVRNAIVGIQGALSRLKEKIDQDEIAYNAWVKEKDAEFARAEEEHKRWIAQKDKETSEFFKKIFTKVKGTLGGLAPLAALEAENEVAEEKEEVAETTEEVYLGDLIMEDVRKIQDQIKQKAQIIYGQMQQADNLDDVLNTAEAQAIDDLVSQLEEIKDKNFDESIRYEIQAFISDLSLVIEQQLDKAKEKRAARQAEALVNGIEDKIRTKSVVLFSKIRANEDVESILSSENAMEIDDHVYELERIKLGTKDEMLKIEIQSFIDNFSNTIEEAIARAKDKAENSIEGVVKELRADLETLEDNVLAKEGDKDFSPAGVRILQDENNENVAPFKLIENNQQDKTQPPIWQGLVAANKYQVKIDKTYLSNRLMSLDQAKTEYITALQNGVGIEAAKKAYEKELKPSKRITEYLDLVLLIEDIQQQLQEETMRSNQNLVELQTNSHRVNDLTAKLYQTQQNLAEYTRNNSDIVDAFDIDYADEEPWMFRNAVPMIAREVTDNLPSQDITVNEQAIESYIASLKGHKERMEFSRAVDDYKSATGDKDPTVEQVLPFLIDAELVSSAVRREGGIDMAGINIETDAASSTLAYIPFDIENFNGFKIAILSIEETESNNKILALL